MPAMRPELLLRLSGCHRRQAGIYNGGLISAPLTAPIAILCIKAR